MAQTILFALKRWLLLFLALGLVLAARLWNWNQIFSNGHIYFIDADCYSRMTRVAAVVAHPATVLRHHNFENWPAGTTPHTTVLLDYAIAALVGVLHFCTAQPMDIAGAFIGVLIAVVTGAVLWKWSCQFRLSTQIAILLTFAVSPILVHGTVLGRPDHQASLILFVVLALTSEWEMQKTPTPRWAALINGLAWGFALWTSLFEPLILLACCILGGIVGSRAQWFNRRRAQAFIIIGIVLLVALAVERWRISSLPTGPLFEHWSRSIGELVPVGWFSRTYFGWAGWAIAVAPLVLVWQFFKKRNASTFLWLVVLLATWLLSTTAARWGYFLAIAYLFTIPFILEKCPNRWLVALFFIGFWPVAQEWDQRLWPTQEEQERLAEQQEDYRELRQICASIPPDSGGVIAPWWLSPPIAYWSGAPCVAGSSHQSLPGIADVARFYLSRFPTKSLEIIRARQVRWVIAYEPSRVLSTASSLLDIPPASDAFANILYNEPRRVPAFLTLTRETQFFKLYHVTKGF